MVLGEIKKWGNSLALRIPKDLAQTLELHEGSQMTLELTTDGLLLKLAIPKRRSTKNLEELLQGITPEKIHREVDWGQAVGNEVW
jgi:antitoxin MazE